jgi:oxygen-dependent protoporphyrinogen oxidase
LRALVDLVLPGRVTGPDVSVGELIRKRLGSGVLERMADPMLAASRAGRALDLSLEAAAPELDQIARRRSSLIRGLRAHKEQSRTADGPPFLGIGSGMESLVQRLHDSLGTVELRIGDEVKDLARHGDSYFLSGAREEEFDAVILAIPSHSAAAVLRQASPRTARLLSTIRYSSAVVAVLVYEEGSLTPPDRGSGFLVPTIEGRGVTAGAWYSLKWEQARPSDNSTVIRCFAGRARDDPVLNVDETGDDELRSRLVREVGEITKTRKRPAEIHLKRWPLALPQYEVGHNRRVADAEATLASDLPRVRIAGAGYRGSGLPDCISQAHAAARILMG